VIAVFIIIVASDMIAAEDERKKRDEG